MESSNGLQCFLRDLPAPCPPQLSPGVVASYLESEWCLVAVVQGEGLWRNVSLPAGTKYILSVTWSDVETRGRLFHKSLPECSPEEIVAECLAQCGVDKGIVIGWQIDHELRFMEENDYRAAANTLAPHLAIETEAGRRLLNFSPLSILLPGARSHAPDSYRGPQPHARRRSGPLAGTHAVHSNHGESGQLRIHRRDGDCAPNRRPGGQKSSDGLQRSLPFAALRRLDQWLWNNRRPRASREIGVANAPFASATKAASRGAR